MKRLLVLLAFVCLQYLPVLDHSPIGSPSVSVAEAKGAKTVRVRRYSTKTGKSVAPHMRSRPKK